MDGYATTLAEEHRNDEAEKLLRETLDVRHRVLGPDIGHTDVDEQPGKHAVSGGPLWRRRETEREALAIQRRVLGPTSRYRDVHIQPGRHSASQGKPDEALSLLREAVDHGLAPILPSSSRKIPISRRCTVTRAFSALVAHAKERAVAAQKSN